MGVNSARSLCLRRLSRQPFRDASDGGDLDAPLAAVSSDVRRGTHQIARRPMLARPDLPRLPLRDTAHAKPAELVLPLGSAVDAQGRRALQSFRRTDGAF